MVGVSSSTNNQNKLLVDDFYFSALHDKDEIFPISDELYAEELQLQEASMSSAIFSKTKNVSPKMEDYNNCIPKKETGESSQSQRHQSFCFICIDAKSTEEMFRSNNCTHSFCNNCTANYVASRIQENISMVKCPELECKGILEPQFCRGIIPKEVYDRWEEALSESLVLGPQKLYCPFKDCLAMLVDDGEQIATVSECPTCHRLFCAQCMVPWHEGINCKEFQKLGKDEREKEDIMLMDLAQNNKWKRCPSCKFYMEKILGCLHIKCRCGFEFCYGCGSTWSQIHQCRQL